MLNVRYCNVQKCKLHKRDGLAFIRDYSRKAFCFVNCTQFIFRVSVLFKYRVLITFTAMLNECTFAQPSRDHPDHHLVLQYGLYYLCGFVTTLNGIVVSKYYLQ